MNMPTRPRRSDPWVEPPDPADRAEPGYEAALRDALARARAELDSGQGIPATEVWKALGIE
jgi:hypothetical protein